MEGGLTLSRFLVGGVLAWVAVSVAFGPELIRSLVRLRSRSFETVSIAEPPARPR